jgi:predicted MPP superfamily phosphohydrolase
LASIDRATLRRLLFDRFFFNLALLLGLSQMVVWYWLRVVVTGREPAGLLPSAALAAALVLINALAVPRLSEARGRPDLAGVLARGYLDVGVATLVIGLAIAAASALLLFVAGLLGAMGAAPGGAFGVFRVGSTALVGVVALSLISGFTVGQARVERTHVRVRVRGLAPQLSGMRIVQISDLHIGNYLEGGRLSRMVERTNALDPDVVALTGDLFDRDPAQVDDGVRRLAQLRARYGVYAVLGNHDHAVGADFVAGSFARFAPNIRLLRDEIAQLPSGAPLYVAGADDPGRDWTARGLALPGLEALAAERPDDGPVLLLVHRPEVFPQAARLGFPLVLSGHTHGGQLALPLAGGRYNLASLVTSFTRGLYRRNGSTLYVNRGLGVGGPALRVHCPREITTIELAA